MENENPLTVIDMENDVGPGWRPLLHELHQQLTEAGFSYEHFRQRRNSESCGCTSASAGSRT